MTPRDTEADARIVIDYSRDCPNDDARAIAGVFSRRDLERMVEMRASRKPLASRGA